MAPSRDDIIEALQRALEPNSAVLALWLEGADATGTVDEFSDIDIWLDVTDGEEQAAFRVVEETLSRLGDIDLNVGPERHGKVADKTFHIRGTPEYLFVDVCVQSHGRQFEFVAGHDTEKPLVLFDKASVIRYREPAADEIARDVARRLAHREAGFAQRARVLRAAKRGHFLEALAYYHKFVLQPLIEVLRLRYDPLKADYWLKHIERDLPPAVLEQLRPLFVVATAEDIAAAVGRTESLFMQASKDVRAEYGL